MAQVPEVVVTDDEYNLLTVALVAAERTYATTTANPTNSRPPPPLSSASVASVSASAAISCYITPSSGLSTSVQPQTQCVVHPRCHTLLLTLQPRPCFPPPLYHRLLPLSLPLSPPHTESHPHSHQPHHPLHFPPSSLPHLRALCQSHRIALNFPDILARALSVLHHPKLQNTVTPHVVSSTLPKQIWTQLFPFQRSGVLRAVCALNGRVLIADDMGLGKTVQALAIAEFYHLSNSKSMTYNQAPIMVLCPATLRMSWAAAIVRWIPSASHHSVSVITSPNDLKLALNPPRAPRDAWDAPQHLTHIVCSYDLLARLPPDLLQHFNQRLSQEQPNSLHNTCTIGSSGIFTNTTSQPPSSSSQRNNYNLPSIVIADECHNLRNVHTSRTRAAMPFITAARIRILVSGTPALAKPSDIFSVLYALLHDREANAPFLSFPAFEHRYVHGSACASRAHELNAILSSVMVRRSKLDVQVQLPPKQRVRVVASVAAERLCHISDMLEQANNLSRQFKKPSFQYQNQNQQQQQDKTSIACLKQQREALFTAMYSATADIKLGPVITRLYQLLFTNTNTTNKKKILVFAHHVRILDAIAGFLEGRRIEYVRIDGSIQCDKRESLIETFQSGTDPFIQVALLSINVAATGITLTKADVVLFAELCWVPALLIQAENRAHRIGRVGPVTVEYVIVPGSLDDLMMRALTGKAGLVFKMVDHGHVGTETETNANSLQFQQEDSVSACMHSVELSELDVQQVVSKCVIGKCARDDNTNNGKVNKNPQLLTMPSLETSLISSYQSSTSPEFGGMIPQSPYL